MATTMPAMMATVVPAGRDSLSHAGAAVASFPQTAGSADREAAADGDAAPPACAEEAVVVGVWLEPAVGEPAVVAVVAEDVAAPGPELGRGVPSPEGVGVGVAVEVGVGE